MSPVESVDEILIRLLGPELLRLLLSPPKVPSFARETVRPSRKS